MSKIIRKYDENNNLIYYKSSYGYEHWAKFDENNNNIYWKSSNGSEYWYKYNKNGKEIKITKQEFEKIQYNTKIKEYNSRTKCSRFEIIDI